MDDFNIKFTIPDQGGAFLELWERGDESLREALKNYFAGKGTLGVVQDLVDEEDVALSQRRKESA